MPKGKKEASIIIAVVLKSHFCGFINNNVQNKSGGIHIWRHQIVMGAFKEKAHETIRLQEMSIGAEDRTVFGQYRVQKLSREHGPLPFQLFLGSWSRNTLLFVIWQNIKTLSPWSLFYLNIRSNCDNFAESAIKLPKLTS